MSVYSQGIGGENQQRSFWKSGGDAGRTAFCQGNHGGSFSKGGIVALTSPEAGGKRRGATGHVYWGLRDTFTLQCGSDCWQQNLGMQGHEMQRKSVLSADRQEMRQ